MRLYVNQLARAVGGAGGRLAMTSVATISIIFFFFSYFSLLRPFLKEGVPNQKTYLAKVVCSAQYTALATLNFSGSAAVSECPRRR